uniref:Integrase catalytic domain-containing protein n=1 Tax=Cannabis sativa TaxID=3483 RepID=A0A803PHV6_CANSA
MFKAEVELQLGTKIKMFQSDWGGEYRSFIDTLQAAGILHTKPCPTTQEQNDIVERKQRHIVENDLTLLAQANLPLKYWDDAFRIAVYLHNRLPTLVLSFKSPIEVLFNITPDYSKLKVFGYYTSQEMSTTSNTIPTAHVPYTVESLFPHDVDMSHAHTHVIGVSDPPVPASDEEHDSQAKYIKDLLHKAKMDEVKPSNTPMDSGLKLSAYGSSLVDNPHMYKSIVRVLQYLIITRLEISFSVNKVCQLMANPLQSHWHAVKRILRYLSGTIDYGIHLIKSDHLDLTAFYDADWATDLDDKCSNSGFTIFFGCNLIAWQCNKQHIVSRSSTEAEF